MLRPATDFFFSGSFQSATVHWLDHRMHVLVGTHGGEVARPIFPLTCCKTLAYVLRVARMRSSWLGQVAHSGQEAGCMWEGSSCHRWRPPRISRRGASCGSSLQLGRGCIVVVVVHWRWLLLFSSQESVVHPSWVLAEYTARSGLHHPFPMPGPKLMRRAADCDGSTSWA